MATLTINLADFQLFLLIFLRVGAIMMSLPLLGGKNIPFLFKAGLAISVSVILFPLLELDAFPYFSETIPLVIGATSEIMLGLIIGLSVNIIFAGIQLAGQLIGYQMGFAIANVMDPQTGSQSSIFASFTNIVALLLFLAFNAHHWFLRGLTESFKLVPLFNFRMSGSLAEHFILIGSDMFIIALKVAAPVMAALLLTSVALGIVARTVPKMNIFLVGMPLKIALGIMFVAFSLPYLSTFLRNIFNALGNSMHLLLKTI